MSLYTTNTGGQPIRIDFAVDGTPTVTVVAAGSSAIPGTPVLTSAQTLITDALEDIGVGGDGETLSADSMQRGLRRLNRMLDSWNSERLAIPAVQHEEFVLTTAASYTIGPGADFNTTRPPVIEFARWKDANGTEYPVRVLTVQEWNRIHTPAVMSDRVTAIYYEADAGVGTINCYPTPTGGMGTLILGTWKQLRAFTSLTDAVSLPPAYEEAIVNHLAVRLAPSYGQEAPTTVVQLAIKSKANLKRMNAPTIEMRCDPALTGRGCFDITTGDWSR